MTFAQNSAAGSPFPDITTRECDFNLGA